MSSQQLAFPIDSVQPIDYLVGLRQMPDHCIDLILTDPPYGRTACRWDKAPDLKAMWAEFNRVIKPSGAVVVTATQPFATDVINANRRRFRYDLVWVKNNPVGFLNARRMPLRKHEHLLVFYGKLPTYHPQKVKGVLYQSRTQKVYPSTVYRAIKRTVSEPSDERYPTSVLAFSRDTAAWHPTQKPLALFQWVIKTYSNAGETVLDPFMGSRTTAIAARLEGRRFLGFETDEICFAHGAERFQEVFPDAR
jgi:site-specific DNA-methyltransferase (adenine-specific)